MNDARTPMRQDIIEVVSRVFELPVDVVAAGISPDQVEKWDSEKHVELVVALEEHFGCMFEPEEVPELTSIDQMETVIAGHVRGSNA
jgi:acyl carrier protein